MEVNSGRKSDGEMANISSFYVTSSSAGDLAQIVGIEFCLLAAANQEHALGLHASRAIQHCHLESFATQFPGREQFVGGLLYGFFCVEQ